MKLGAQTWALVMAVGMCCISPTQCQMITQMDFSQSETKARYPMFVDQGHQNFSSMMQPQEASDINTVKDYSKFVPCYYGNEDVFAKYTRTSVTPFSITNVLQKSHVVS